MIRRIAAIILIAAFVSAAIGMPMALAFCGNGGSQMLPFMGKTCCAIGVQSARTHLAAFFALASAVVVSLLLLLFVFPAQRAEVFCASPGPPASLRRFWDLIRALAERATQQKALALGLVPQRHPTFA